MKGFVIPVLLQGSLLLIDEFYFHQRRGLGRWERWGHPIDTLSVLAPIAVATLRPFENPWKAIYAVLALFSCLLVTKDEWIHTRQAPATENWLHSILFMLHPMVFVSSGLQWAERPVGEVPWLHAQLLLLTGFLGYQLGWWCLLGRGRWPS